VQAIVTLSDPAVAVAAVYGGLRVSPRTRLSGSVGAGVSAGELAWRGEVLGHFLFSPEERRGPGFYLAGGLAGVDRGPSQGYVVLTLGLEDRPSGKSGWAVELGVGGGLRLAAAYRRRSALPP
jgi:hypothetical protein